ASPGEDSAYWIIRTPRCRWLFTALRIGLPSRQGVPSPNSPDNQGDRHSDDCPAIWQTSLHSCCQKPSACRYWLSSRRNRGYNASAIGLSLTAFVSIRSNHG